MALCDLIQRAGVNGTTTTCWCAVYGREAAGRIKKYLTRTNVPAGRAAA